MSAIPQKLLDAYRATEFRVLGDPAFVLKVGLFSAEIATALVSWGVCCAAFLTAYNPQSRRLTAEENEAAQARLEGALLSEGYALRPGVGVDPSGRWPAERSVLALGMPRDAAVAIGSRFSQNAVVWIDRDAVPELITCDADAAW